MEVFLCYNIELVQTTVKTDMPQTLRAWNILHVQSDILNFHLSIDIQCNYTGITCRQGDLQKCQARKSNFPNLVFFKQNPLPVMIYLFKIYNKMMQKVCMNKLLISVWKFWCHSIKFHININNDALEYLFLLNESLNQFYLSVWAIQQIKFPLLLMLSLYIKVNYWFFFTVPIINFPGSAKTQKKLCNKYPFKIWQYN